MKQSTRPIKRLTEIEQIASLPGPVALAIGVFDGVHLGHQEIIQRAQNFTKKRGGSTLVVTFDPHPIRLLRPERAPCLLASLPHKERILGDLGVSAILTLPFDQKFAQISAGDFLRDLLIGAEEIGMISVGRSWRFGRLAAGDIELLESFGATYGLHIEGVAPVFLDGAPISSTRVRAAVAAGDFDLSGQLLGRDYSVYGEIVQGEQLGRQLGFPSAKLKLLNEQLPPKGVYAATAEIDGEQHRAVANLGNNASRHPELELHLLDFDADIYGRHMEVTFRTHLRRERKFETLEALREQIAQDIVDARQALSRWSGLWGL